MSARVGLRVASWLGVTLLATLVLISNNAQIVDDVAGPSITVPTIDRSVVARAEADGRICRTEPSLTDVVVVQDAVTDATSIVTFDEALAGASDRTLFVRLYCAPSSGTLRMP